MLETAFSKEAIRIRRDRRDREREGWEFVGEGGGRLWELYRGSRTSYRITEARVSACGLGVWIKTENTRPVTALAETPLRASRSERNE